MTHNVNASIQSLVGDFLRTYDTTKKDDIWREHSDRFKAFWSTRILEGSSGPPSREEYDAMIRVLDRSGKGNVKDSEAVGRTMIPQGAWYKMFDEFRANGSLAKLIADILQENDAERKAALIDQLYAVNEGQKNRLTGKAGITISAFLVAYDPFTNISMVSLNDRRSLIEFLNLPNTIDWDKDSVGSRIVASNALLSNGLKALGLGSARTASAFCYLEPFRRLWKKEHTVERADKTVSVSIPSDAEDEEPVEDGDKEETRESIQVQAALAEIGCRMGFQIWLPKADRGRVLTKWTPSENALLDRLPLNYDDVTLRTIEQIDVLWLRKRSILRAFEVEHTTSIYSGLLRMADLIALQPNMNITLHIVAPVSKREKVLHEIRRPVFSLLDNRPLSEICTYLSYESIWALRDEKHLGHLSPDVLEEYQESAL